MELRVGELEEIEEGHQREIHHLYDQLGHEQSKATRLEAERDQHKHDAQEYLDRLNKATAKVNQLEANFQEKLQQFQLEQARKMQEMAKMANEAAANSRNAKRSSPEVSAEQHELMAMMLKEKTDQLRAAEERFKAEQEKWMQQLRDKDGAVREAQTKSHVEHGQLALKIKELQDADSQSDLRLAQFKARFNVQDERIKDMDQQLSSLYTAFGIIKEDQDQEDKKRAALQINLKEADEEMARQVEDNEKNKSQRHLVGASPNEGNLKNYPLDPWDTRPRQVHTNPHTTPSPVIPPRIIQTPMSLSSTSRGMESPARSSIGRASIAQSYASPSPSVTVKPYTPSPRRTPDTWDLLFPEPGSNKTRYSDGVSGDGLVIKGVLLVKSKSVVRKWKSKFCKLYRQRNHYQWDMEGKSYTLGYGISKVEFNPNHPLSFIVHCNPFDDMAPVVYAAASTVEDYNIWMEALTRITTGREYELHSLEGSPRRPEAALSSTRTRSDEASSRSAMSAEEQEAADLQQALLLSQDMK